MKINYGLVVTGVATIVISQLILRYIGVKDESNNK